MRSVVLLQRWASSYLSSSSSVKGHAYKCLGSVRTCSSLVSTSTHDQFGWADCVVRRFEVRPSALSPLHSPYRQNEDIDLKRQLLKNQLRAQMILNTSELHLDDGEEIADALQSRSIKFGSLMDKYQLLRQQDALPLCDHPAYMYAYYNQLTQQAIDKDPDSKGSYLVSSGQEDVWNFWDMQFTEKYMNTPSLEPLEVIYNKQDPEAQLEKLRAQARSMVSRTFNIKKISLKPAGGWYHAVGGRKTSSASIMLSPGEGRIMVNKKPYDQYFTDITCRAHLLKPLLLTNTAGLFDVLVMVHGGGPSGQAQAAAHGISKALAICSPQLGPQLGKAKLLTRDKRAVERKKPGLKKARKAFTWVKR